MPATDKSHAALLAELAALDPPQRREVAAILRTVVETFAEVPDGRHTAHNSPQSATPSIEPVYPPRPPSV